MVSPPYILDSTSSMINQFTSYDSFAKDNHCQPPTTTDLRALDTGLQTDKILEGESATPIDIYDEFKRGGSECKYFRYSRGKELYREIIQRHQGMKQVS